LPRLAPLLPVAIPVPLANGAPAQGYPCEWAIYPWLEGKNLTDEAITDVDALTQDIVQFVAALQRVDLPGGPPARRGAPLTVQDEEARPALDELRGMIDTDAATAAWDEALKTPGWSGPPVWIHGDLLPGNLLLQGGRLSGVIDWAGLGVGDPACDMIVAWGLLPPAARDTFRDALGVDDATWARGRGWALSIGLIALPYYKETNPGLAATARKSSTPTSGRDAANLTFPQPSTTG
jgi:aminoglycoside phosphotransferase (APT) family kinase protein